MGHKKSSNSDVYRMIAAAEYHSSLGGPDSVDPDQLDLLETAIEQGLDTVEADAEAIANDEWSAPTEDEDEDELDDEDVDPIEPEDMVTDLFVIRMQSTFDAQMRDAKRAEATRAGSSHGNLDACAETFGGLDDLTESSSDPSAHDPLFDPRGKNLFTDHYVISDIIESTAPHLSYDTVQDFCYDLLERLSEKVSIPPKDQELITMRILGNPRMLNDTVCEALTRPTHTQHALAISEIYDKNRVVFALSRLAGKNLDTVVAREKVLNHFCRYLTPEEAKQLCSDLKRHHDVGHVPLRTVLSNPSVLDPTREFFEKTKVVAAITSEVKKYLP